MLNNYMSRDAAERDMQSAMAAQAAQKAAADQAAADQAAANVVVSPPTINTDAMLPKRAPVASSAPKASPGVATISKPALRTDTMIGGAFNTGDDPTSVFSKDNPHVAALQANPESRVARLMANQWEQQRMWDEEAAKRQQR